MHHRVSWQLVPALAVQMTLRQVFPEDEIAFAGRFRIDLVGPVMPQPDQASFAGVRRRSGIETRTSSWVLRASTLTGMYTRTAWDIIGPPHCV
jgi:hypothetical protein